MLKRAVTILQDELKKKGLHAGRVDGKAGPATREAVTKYLNLNRAKLPADAASFTDERNMVLAFQVLCSEKGIAAEPFDGNWGPVTQNAFDELDILLRTGTRPRNWRDEVPLDDNPHQWPRDRPGQQELRAFYGQPGSPPLKSVRCPWVLKLAWAPSQTLTHISIHQKVAGSLEQVLERVHRHYGDSEIKRLRLDLYGGAFANRKKRGGSSWSMHAYGVAIDWDPARNQLKWGRDRATLDHPDYLFWWNAWEQEGWVSLGRSRNFDWMHVQAARL